MNNALNEYARTGSSEAFGRVVKANIDVVYSQCLRKLGNVAQAEDVTQVVFATLAQKAAKLPAGVVLEGWLFTTTRFCCSNAQRSAARRSAAEKKAATMRNETIETTAASGAASAEIEQLLDDAVAHLGEGDRNAVLLRFFGGRSMSEVGDVMGVSEDAARQRIFRAIEKLRDYFRRRGITAETAAITASLSAAITPAGADLARSTLQLAITKAAAKATVAKVGLLGWTLPKIGAGLAAAVAITGAVVVVSSGGAAPQPPATQPTVAQVSATPVLADVAPPPDATQRLNQDTPIDTLKKLSASIQTNNRDAITECLCDNGSDPDAATMGKAFFFEQAGVCRLQQAWQAKFPQEMKLSGLNFDDFPGHGSFATVLAHMIDAPDGLQPTIDGANAKVRVNLPKTDFIAEGPNQIDALGHWSGATLVFKQIDGNWKLDTVSTFNFVANIARHPGNTKSPMAIMAKIATGLGDGLNATAADIENGKVATPQKAVTRITAAAMKAFKDANVDGAAFMTLPVVGG